MYSIRKNKKFALFLAIAFALSIVLPLVVAAPVLASATLKCSPANVVPGAVYPNDIRVSVELPAGALTGNAELRMRLPDNATVVNATPTGVTDNSVLGVTAESYVNGAWGPATVASKDFRFLVTKNPAKDHAALFYFDIKNLDVEGGTTGDIVATFEAQAGTPYAPGGSVVIAYVGTGSVDVTIDDTTTFSSAGSAIDPIRIKEDRARTLQNGNKSITLKLPNGFYWNNVPGVTTYWGTNVGATFTRADENRTLEVNVANQSTDAAYFALTGLNIRVDDTLAKSGEVVVTIGGNSSVKQSALTIGYYGDYGVELKSITTPDVYAGKIEQKVGEFSIEEAIGQSLVGQRTILFTLPEGAKWMENVNPRIKVADSNQRNLTFLAPERPGTDNRTIKLTVNNPSSAGKGAKLVFEKGEIAVAADFRGDLVMEVSGSAGVSGNIVIAKVVSPVDAKVSSVPDVKIGLQAQSVADMTITEAKKEIFDSGKKAGASDKVIGFKPDPNNPAQFLPVYDSADRTFVLRAPVGVVFAANPTFEVTEGDLVLDQSSIVTSITGDQRGEVSVRVKGTSSVPSTIKVSNIKLTVDRTVPEGDLKLQLRGLSLVESTVYFPAKATVESVTVAKCVTPHPSAVTQGVEFVIGSTTYKVNGAEQTMDVAPYVKDGRTYLPVRYVANSLGVVDTNIMWDSANGTVTMLKGDKVVQVTVGSKTMSVNGASIAMDAAPEITNGRTMLPFRWIAWAFGASVDWDAASQTVTMEL